MINPRILAISTLLVGATAWAATGPERLVPAPVDYTVTAGAHVLRADGKDIAEVVGGRAFRRTVAGLPAFAREEAYRLTVTPRKVRIEAVSETGAFRARQTLRQLRLYGDTLSCFTLLDYPRFRHRSLMIDESRSFKGKEFILKQIDAMALLKLNILHLHLVDAAGWRIRIDARPRLTDSTAWRIGRDYFAWERGGRRFTSADDPAGTGGCYSHEDLREIVAYAAARHIDVIPEIEMPGHSYEVGYAYPEATCLLPDGRHIPGTWDLCPGAEETFRLLEAVLTEVMDIFPYRYIHIGGDEASMKDWARCVRCRERRMAEGLDDERQLQGYLVRRIDAFVRAHGRRIIGWDEILETGVPAEAAIQSWRGTEGGLQAIAAGHDVVMSPNSHLYLDYYQDIIRKEPPACGHLQSLRHVYGYDPAEGIPADGLPHLLGVQGNLWCEYIPTREHAEYMLYPRAFAVAEIGWSPQEVRDYAGFRERVLSFLPRFRSLGYNAFDTAGETPRARSRCFETYTYERGYNHVQQDGGPDLGYNGAGSVRIIVDGEFGFKDMDGNGRLDPFEDWRLDAATRARDLAGRLTVAQAATLGATPETLEDLLREAFQAGIFENPYPLLAGPLRQCSADGF